MANDYWNPEADLNKPPLSHKTFNQIDLRKYFIAAMSKRLQVYVDEKKLGKGGAIDFFIASCAEAAEHVFYQFRDMNTGAEKSKHKYADMTKTKMCTRCLTTMHEDDKFCSECGFKNIRKVA